MLPADPRMHRCTDRRSGNGSFRICWSPQKCSIHPFYLFIFLCGCQRSTDRPRKSSGSQTVVLTSLNRIRMIWQCLHRFAPHYLEKSILILLRASTLSFRFTFVFNVGLRERTKTPRWFQPFRGGMSGKRFLGTFQPFHGLIRFLFLSITYRAKWCSRCRRRGS